MAKRSSLDPLSILLQLQAPLAAPACIAESLGAWELWPLMLEKRVGGSQLEDPQAPLRRPQDHPDPV